MLQNLRGFPASSFAAQEADARLRHRTEHLTAFKFGSKRKIGTCVNLVDITNI